MRFVQSAFALLLLGVPFAACTIFDARGDCEKNPFACEGGASGGTGGTVSTGTIGAPRCDDGSKNGDEDGIDCGGASCRKCIGEPCSALDGSECASEHCVDGFCCDEPCGSVCKACDLAGLEGTCSPLQKWKNDPKDQSCDSLGGCGDEPGYCRCNDGVKGEGEADVDCGGSCAPKKCAIGAQCAADQDCSSGHCVDDRCCANGCAGKCLACDVEEHFGLCSPLAPGEPDACETDRVCDGAAQCKTLATKSCSTPSSCLSNNCLLSGKCGDCACTPTQLCIGGACVEKVGDGQFCHTSDQCYGGNCFHGVCCPAGCAGRCMGCRPEYTDKNDNTCAPIKAGLDPHGECDGTRDGAACSGDDPDEDGNSSCGEP